MCGTFRSTVCSDHPQDRHTGVRRRVVMTRDGSVVGPEANIRGAVRGRVLLDIEQLKFDDFLLGHAVSATTLTRPSVITMERTSHCRPKRRFPIDRIQLSCSA